MLDADIIRQAFETGYLAIADFVPRLVAAIVVFFIGWLVAVLLGRAAYHIVKIAGINRALASLGLGRLLERAGMGLNAPLFFYEAVKWFLIIVFLMAATNVLGLEQFTDFLGEVLLYIPNVIAAALILLIGALVGKFLGNLVRSSVKAAHLSAGNFLGSVTRWAIFVFALLAALVQLKVATEIIEIVIIGIVAGAALAFGLAFGLGGRDMARDMLEDLRGKLKE